METPTLRGVVRAYLMSMAFWSGLALLMGLQYRPLSRGNFWPAFATLLVEAALRGLAFTIWTPPIFYLVGKYLSLSGRRVRYVLLWGLGSAPFVLLHTTIMWVLVPPYDDALQRYVARSFRSWAEMIRGGFADEIFIYIAIVVAAHAYEYLKRLRWQERERYEYQQALVASELQTLKMQLHPHFLFNTLQGIAALVEDEPQTAEAMILKLSNLLRTALDRGQSDLIPLEEELNFAREYLDLEKMRFGDRLRVEWSIAPEARRVLVPQMILQPIVENAVLHGISSRREGGWIEVAASVENQLLTIQLRNSGAARSPNGSGLGLSNVKARLKYLYPDGASLNFLLNQEHVATVTLSVPALPSRSAPAKEIPAHGETRDPLCEFSSSTTNL